MKSPDLAEKLARTVRDTRTKEREAEEQIASAVQESATHRELWYAKASNTLQVVHVQQCGFSDVLGQISKNLRAFRDLFKPSVVAVLTPQLLCPSALLVFPVPRALLVLLAPNCWKLAQLFKEMNISLWEKEIHRRRAWCE